jgi:hypothetical protein
MEDTGNENKGKLPDLEKCQAKVMIPDFSDLIFAQTEPVSIQ